MKRAPVAFGFVMCALLTSCSAKEGAPAPGSGRNASYETAPPAPGRPSSTPQAPGATQAAQKGDAPALPEELRAQWSRFQAALKADDTKLLAEVAHFPLESNEFGGTIPSAEILKQRYATLFPAPTKQCLLASIPKREEVDGDVFFEVYCDVGPYPIRFIFSQVGSRFSWTGIDNINE